MLTVPLNPSRLATVIVELPLTPVFTISAVAPAVTVKSWTVYWTVVERERARLVPVIVTV